MAFEKFKPLMNIRYTLRVADLVGEPAPTSIPGGKDQVKLRVDVLAPTERAMSGASWYTYDWVIERLRRAGVQPGVEFDFLPEQQGGNKAEMRIFAGAVSDATEIPESDLERQLPESRERALAQRTVTPGRVTEMPKTAPVQHTLASQALAGCLIAAIDATSSAIAYASKKGVAFNPTSEDIQGLASTLFIQMSKMGGGLNAMAPSAEQQQFVNGGTKWPQ